MRWLTQGDIVVIAAELAGVEPEDLATDLDLEAVAAALVAARQESRSPCAAVAALFAALARNRPFGSQSLALAWLSCCQQASLNDVVVPTQPTDELASLLRGIADGRREATELADWLATHQQVGSEPQRTKGGQKMSGKRKIRGGPLGGRVLRSARFTDRARQVLALAQDEARLLQHNFIGTEHILLGLVTEGTGVGAKALESLGISSDMVRARVREIIGPGGSEPTGAPPFTPRAKKVLELALREALQLGHNYIGTEHLLLGLVREGEGVATKVLGELGADSARVRETVIQILSQYAKTSAAGPELRDRLRRDIADLIDSNAALEAEVARLRGVLEAHNISPDSGERSA